MENEYKTHGDGGFKSDNQNKNGSAEEKQPQQMVSPRKLQANRENAKKSTGPRTARGKRISSFNALKHGLQAKKVIFATDGKLLDEGLQQLFETLHDRYSTGEVADELLIELAIMDCWRLQKGLEYELKHMAPRGDQFHPQGAMPTLLRYMTANRRSFDKSLQMLRQLPANNTDEDAKANTVDGKSESPENDSWVATHRVRHRRILLGKRFRSPQKQRGWRKALK
jgi:hypothetical protein